MAQQRELLQRPLKPMKDKLNKLTKINPRWQIVLIIPLEMPSEVEWKQIIRIEIRLLPQK